MWEEVLKQVLREWGPVGLSVVVVAGVIAQALKANRDNQERLLASERSALQRIMESQEKADEERAAITERFIVSMETTVKEVSEGIKEQSGAIRTLAEAVDSNNRRLAEIAICVDTLADMVGDHQPTGTRKSKVG